MVPPTTIYNRFRRSFIPNIRPAKCIIFLSTRSPIVGSGGFTARGRASKGFSLRDSTP